MNDSNLEGYTYKRKSLDSDDDSKVVQNRCGEFVIENKSNSVMELE